MEDFVQMSLERYDTLKHDREYLMRELKEEQESHNKNIVQAERTIKDLAKKIEQYKKYILGRNCRMIDADNYSLKYYLDINTWAYGIDYKDDLLKLGFTKQEMDEFISNEYKKAVKEKEENKKEENTDD